MANPTPLRLDISYCFRANISYYSNPTFNGYFKSDYSLKMHNINIFTTILNKVVYRLRWYQMFFAIQHKNSVSRFHSDFKPYVNIVVITNFIFHLDFKTM